jgi:hypothetical protein
LPKPIQLITWKWDRPGYRDTYTAEMVNTFYDMVARHTTVPYEPLCITDNPEGVKVPTWPLWGNPAPAYGKHDPSKPNCYYRLRMFSSEWRDRWPKFVWFDLDSVIMGNIDALLTDPAEFKIWQPDGEKMPCNGSLVLHQNGTRPRIWTDFDPKTVHARHGHKYHTGFQGSDQAWIAHKLGPHDQKFTQKDGVFSFRSHVYGEMVNEQHRVKDLDDVKVLFFNGRWKPWQADVQEMFPWIRDHYR